MYYLLHCDISTLRCTASDLERKLGEFSTRYYKVSDCLWIFCMPKDSVCHAFVSPCEYFVTHILAEYKEENSVLFAMDIHKNSVYSEALPDAEKFISIDDPDYD